MTLDEDTNWQENVDWQKLRYLMEELTKTQEERRALERRHIMDTDPNAPICINCRFCHQRGFLFHCPIYELPEDGEVVGNFGDVYYRRKGHKPKTYPNTPMNPEDCDTFQPLSMRIEEVNRDAFGSGPNDASEKLEEES